MIAEQTKSAIQTLSVVKEVLIAAPATVVFETVLEPHGPLKDMNMKLWKHPYDCRPMISSAIVAVCRKVARRSRDCRSAGTPRFR